MRILHVSWEYPPVVYGGLGRHVHALAQEQAQQGHDVWVLTQLPPGASRREEVNSVKVARVRPPEPQVPREPQALVDWVRGLDEAMAHRATELVAEVNPQIIHAHDWVVTAAARAARSANRTPLVSTIHATEAGRHQGWISGAISTEIHTAEYRLAQLSQRIITCSTKMAADVSKLFGVPRTDIDVIPNGIDASTWRVDPDDVQAARQRWAPSGQLVVFVGRLEWEKGIHTLIEALARTTTPGLHAVIAGTGTYEAELMRLATPLVEEERITFTGWLPQAELQGLQAAADVIVVPSLYEPFGLVALEAGALGIPVVVADTGGLGDIVDHGRAGYLFPAGDSAALAQALDAAVNDVAVTAHKVAAMHARISTDYQWDRIVASTTDTYERAIAEDSTTPRDLDPPGTKIVATNLLDPDV